MAIMNREHTRTRGATLAVVEIRVANESQIDHIAGLLQAAYVEYTPPPGDSKRPSWNEYYTKEMPDVRSRWSFSQHLIVVNDGRIVGTATYFPDGSHPGLHNDRWPPGYAAMRLLAVDPAERGRGIGRALTEDCLRRASDAGREWFGLHTTELMKTARAMYERMGFERFPDNDIPVTETFTVVAYRLALS